MRALTLGALVALLALFAPGSATADPDQSCTFNQQPALPFGQYDPLSRIDTTTISQIAFNCRGKSFQVQILINGGSNGTVLNRRMLSPGDALHYQIYQDVARSQIWGDGTGAPPVTIFNDKNNTNYTLNAYAVIPAGQDSGTGLYADVLLVTLMY